VPKIPIEDLEHILNHTQDLWSELDGQRIFITGGTGFFGCWLLESLVWAIDRLNLNTKAVILTRDISAFKLKVPHLSNHPAIEFYAGDVRTFKFPDGKFSHVIHGATAASASLNSSNPLLMIDTIVQGTKHTLEFAKQCGATKFLLTSSGAVYGRQPSDITHLSEDYLGAPDPLDPANAYGEAKRLSELMCAIASHESQLETKIARCFAFVGPHLPLDTHFAIGNFIRDSLQGKSIQILGDGTPYRSYLYAADLTIWLWKILFRGKSCQSYNVGSDLEISISELGKLVIETARTEKAVIVHKQPAIGKAPERYVPSIDKARSELQLQLYIDLQTSIQKTINWYRQQNSSTP
jgi:nucleoside-diphosphate-sugar epimerase